MKLLIISVIVLVIPAFFVCVFVMSTVNRLASLRQRCRQALQRINANAVETPTTPATSRPDPVHQARETYSVMAEQYNKARKQLPARLLAALWGFHEMEPLPERAAEGRPATHDKPA